MEGIVVVVMFVVFVAELWLMRLMMRKMEIKTKTELFVEGFS